MLLYNFMWFKFINHIWNMNPSSTPGWLGKKGRDKREERRGRKRWKGKGKGDVSFRHSKSDFFAASKCGCSEIDFGAENNREANLMIFMTTWGHISRIFGRERVTLKMGCTRIIYCSTKMLTLRRSDHRGPLLMSRCGLRESAIATIKR